MQVKIYYMNGTTYEGDRFEAPHRTDPSKVLHREDGPAIEYISGDKAWYLNGRLHRIDGPAIEHFDGYKAWYQNGKQHREDGPAIEYFDGAEWCLDYEQYTQDEFNRILKEIDSLDPAVGLLDPREWVRNRWKRRLNNVN